MGTLSLREAADKYGISASTVSHWHRDGLIRVASAGTRGQPTLVFECDVAQAAALQPRGKGGRGRRKALKAAILGLPLA